MPLRRRRAIALLASLGFFATAHATEGGGTCKALGVDTVLAGLMPPPGLRLTTFIAGYETDRTLDGTGNPRPGLSNFDLRVEALTLRFQYVWPGVQIAGAQVETRFGSNVYLDSRVSFDVRTPAGTTVHREDSVTSGGDAIFAPVLLGWHGERFHQTAGVQFYLPTGSFDAAKLANPGRGYSAIGPIYAFTWFPTDAWELSMSANYLFNQTNSDTRYRSGRELSIDYGTGFDVTRAWQVGASGYLYKQVSDDTLNGQSVAGGNRGQAFAIGPFVRFHPGKDWGVTLKWQHETSVENRTSGDRLFLQIALQLW
jgi:hypothetical protein